MLIFVQFESVAELIILICSLTTCCECSSWCGSIVVGALSLLSHLVKLTTTATKVVDGSSFAAYINYPGHTYRVWRRPVRPSLREEQQERKTLLMELL